MINRQLGLTTLPLLAALALSACGSPSKPASAPTPSAPVSAATPEEIVQRFRDVMRGEMVPAALNMLDDINYSAPTAEQVRLRMRRMANEMATGGYDFKPVDSHIETDCAAVIIRENPQRKGPAQFNVFYLIQRGGGWKLSPEPASYERFQNTTTGQLMTFRALERWYQLRRADLKVETRSN